MIRHILMAAIAFGLTAQAASPALAQHYPSRSVTLVIPFAPGGATDSLGRLLAQKMAESMGQAIVVENRSGAGGSIGSSAAARAAPDGYTLLLGTSSTLGVNPWMFKLPYDVKKDLKPISVVASGEFVLAINPVLHPNIKTVKDLIDLAKTQRLTYGSAGHGSNGHLGGALLAQRSNANFVHVPYKNQAQAQNDLQGGHVDFMIDSISNVVEPARAGTLRILATTARSRSTVLPEVPTMIEAGIDDYELIGWYMLMAPSGTPDAIVAKVNAELMKALNLPDVEKRLHFFGFNPRSSTPDQASQFLSDQLKGFKELVELAGAKVE